MTEGKKLAHRIMKWVVLSFDCIIAAFTALVLAAIAAYGIIAD